MSEAASDIMPELERYEWSVLGRVIGTATGWDMADTFILMVFDFIPEPGLDLPHGAININFETGAVDTYDEFGEVTYSRDLVSIVAQLPIKAAA